MRVLDKDNTHCSQLVRQAIKDVLNCYDPVFTEEILSYVTSLFLKCFSRLISNDKSKYRAAFTPYCKFLLILNYLPTGGLSLTALISDSRKIKSLAEEAAQNGAPLQAWVCPKVQEVIEATRVEADKASVREKEVMFLLLNIALGSVDARLNKQWKPGMTHVSFFRTTYKYEMGVALLLLEYFSDTENILYNAGLADEHGKFIPAAEVRAPKQKKRRKMQTSKNSRDLENSYYEYVEMMEEEMKSPDYEKRMAAWDRLICDEYRCGDTDDREAAPKARTNTVPTTFLNSRDTPGKTAAADFFRRNGLLPSFVIVDDGFDSSGNSLSSAGSPTSNLPPLTQTPNQLPAAAHQAI